MSELFALYFFAKTILVFSISVVSVYQFLRYKMSKKKYAYLAVQLRATLEALWEFALEVQLLIPLPLEQQEPIS